MPFFTSFLVEEVDGLERAQVVADQQAHGFGNQVIDPERETVVRRRPHLQHSRS